ncbi:MAG: hypothetical protein QOH29_2692 [Actinomycetota bacterium]|jgi:hypothetical protein|nr:hypothetical protein [Actinomycetota bacterium]
MPDDEFAEVGVHRSQFVLIVASAVSVVAVVAAVALVVHPWRDAAARSPAAGTTGPATSSASPLTSPATSLPAVSVSEPAFSATPASSPTATNAPSTPPSTTPTVSRRTSPPPPGVAADSPLNFKVSIQASPTQVVLGQHVRVTVTIVNQGGVLDRQVVMAFGGSDPSDNFSDAPPPCKDSTGWISCPISGARPGQKWSFTFTFIPGPFPGMDGFDDAIFAWFDYTDSHGQPQQTPQYFAHVLLFNAPASSPAPGSGAPSNTPLSSAPSSAG